VVVGDDSQDRLEQPAGADREPEGDARGGAGPARESERTLSRLFREELGMTYPQWRRNLRLLRAAILLCSGASVTTAARECGWGTTSSFIEAFRRSMGQTPGAYQAGARR
jgi:AraC-like DNA-binding protein